MAPCSACRSRSSGCSPVRLRLRSPGRWRGRWTSASVAAQSASARRRSTRRWSRRCSRRWPPSASPRSPASSSRSPTRTPSCGRAWRPVEAKSRRADRTFQIRPRVRFQDGKPMTVADVVATFRRLARAGLAGAVVVQGRHSLGTRSVATPCASTSRRRTGSSVPHGSDDVPVDHSAGELDAHGSPEAGRVHEQDERDHRPAPGESVARRHHLGGQSHLRGGRPDRQVEMQVLDDQARVTAPRAGRSISPCGELRGCAAAATGEQEGPADSHCEPPLPEHERHQGAVQRRPGTPGDRAGVGPPGHHTRPLGPVRGGRQRQPDVGRLSVHGEERPTAQAGSRAGTGAPPSGRKGNLQITLTCYRAFEMPDYAQRVAGAAADRNHSAR